MSERITPEKAEDIADRLHLERDGFDDPNMDNPVYATMTEAEFLLRVLVAQMKADQQEREQSQGDVRVPAELAEWVYHLLCRRLETGHKGQYVMAWSDTELGRRDKRWVEALATALGRGEPTPPSALLAEGGGRDE